VILALAAGLGQKVLEDAADLGSYWRWFAAGSLVAALVALLGALIAGLWAFTVRVPEGIYIDTDVLKAFPEREKYTRAAARSDKLESRK
jgi:hypothetical protein